MSAKITVITGASSGIGEALAQRALDRGDTVVGVARGKPAWTHKRFHPVEVDLLDANLARRARLRRRSRRAFLSPPSSTMPD